VKLLFSIGALPQGIAATFVGEMGTCIFSSVKFSQDDVHLRLLEVIDFSCS